MSRAFRGINNFWEFAGFILIVLAIILFITQNSFWAVVCLIIGLISGGAGVVIDVKGQMKRIRERSENK